MQGPPPPNEINPPEGTNPSETKQQARRHIRSTAAIGESEEWLFTTLQSIGDAVIATDARGFIVFMNAVATQLTGWSAEDAQGQDCRVVFRIVNESTRFETESPVDKVMRDGRIAGLANHTILIAKEGTEHSIDDSGSPIRDREGLLTGVVLIFRDITDRRKAELTIVEQQQILQSLLDHLPVIVTFFDEEGRFKWVNREWTHVMGWSLAEMGFQERQNAFSLRLPCRYAEHRDRKTKVSDGTVYDGVARRQVSVQGRAGSRSLVGYGASLRRNQHRHRPGHASAPASGGSCGAAPDRSGSARTRGSGRRCRRPTIASKNNLQAISALLDIQVMDHAEVVPVRELMQIRMHVKTLASIQRNADPGCETGRRTHHPFGKGRTSTIDADVTAGRWHTAYRVGGCGRAVADQAGNVLSHAD